MHIPSMIEKIFRLLIASSRFFQKVKPLHMIERHWKGIAKREMAKDYIIHLKNDTFKRLTTIRGFISAKILKREVAQGIEFLIVTKWQNVDAIRGFAGANIDIAVVPDHVQELMITYDKTVQHYGVDFETGS